MQLQERSGSWVGLLGTPCGIFLCVAAWMPSWVQWALGQPDPKTWLSQNRQQARKNQSQGIIYSRQAKDTSSSWARKCPCRFKGWNSLFRDGSSSKLSHTHTHTTKPRKNSKKYATEQWKMIRQRWKQQNQRNQRYWLKNNKKIKTYTRKPLS